MINQELVKKIQDGTHAIEVDVELKKVGEILKVCFPNDETDCSGFPNNFYVKYCDVINTWTDKETVSIPAIKASKFFLESNSEVEDVSRINTPKHYDNSNGSLYKVARERKWSSYLFDIVKRLERAEKKGVFKEDLQKSKDLIDLYGLEYEKFFKDQID